MLTEMKVTFTEDELIKEAMVKATFYVPEAKLVLNLNNKLCYYPYTIKFNNILNINKKLFSMNNYSVFNINAWRLMGVNNNREGTKAMITRAIEHAKERMKKEPWVPKPFVPRERRP